MKGKKIGILIGVSAVVIAVGASVTVTQQNEYKLIRQFGKVDRVISSSGISFKIPFIESTQSLPKETLLYDLAASDVITKDKKNDDQRQLCSLEKSATRLNLHRH